MKKLALAILMCTAAQPSLAGYGGGTIDRYYVDSTGWVYFGLTSQLPGTCSYFIEQFKFDASTPTGKNLLSVIVSAKLAEKDVTLWYTDSPVPGTTQANGCHAGTMAVLNAAGVR
jgi:hypothetical protein